MKKELTVSKDIPPPSITIKRVDTYSFQLIQIHNGVSKVITQETFGIVMDKADLILRQLAEGSYVFK